MSTSTLGVVAERAGHICWPARSFQTFDTIDTSLLFTAHNWGKRMSSILASAVLYAYASFHYAD